MSTVSFLIKAHLYAALACVLYLLACLSMSHPVLQRQYLFLHNVRFPMFAKYSEPHLYGSLVGQTRNLYIPSTDNVTLGAWHYLPKAFYDAHVNELQNTQAEALNALFDEALRMYPTYVFLHGNGLNRAASFRVRTCSDMAQELNANVFAIDYRGYGDSTGYPTEQGVVDDAYSAVQYVRERSRSATADSGPGIAIVGQSLGTGIGAQTALRMYREGQHLDALILLAAFKELRPMVTEFSLGGVIPLLRPLEWLPIKDFLLDTFLQYRFHSLEALTEILNGTNDPKSVNQPVIIIMHALDDAVINVSHSEAMFTRALNITGATNTMSGYHIWSSSLPDFGYVRSIMSKTARPPEYRGVVPNSRFVLPRSALFTFVELEKGGHDHLLRGNVDALRLMMPTYMLGDDVK